MKIDVAGDFTIYKADVIEIDDEEIKDMTQTQLEKHLDQIVNEWTNRKMKELCADEHNNIGYEVLD